MDENYAQRSLSGKLAMLRSRVRLSQDQIAQSLGVSLTTVCNWETGTVTSPSTKNLQKIIALYLQKRGFTEGKEREEARQLWAESGVKARFDDEWFRQVLTSIEKEEIVANQIEISLTQIAEYPATPVNATPYTSVIQGIDDMVTGERNHMFFASNQEEKGEQYSRSIMRHNETRTDNQLQNWERQRVLEINSSWIQGCLAQTLLQNPMYLQLKLRFLSSEAVDSPQAHMLDIELPDRFFLAADSMRVYDEMGGTLLILGEPGSGKTYLLLDIARKLLKRAYEDEQHPIPVVLNLSSWTKKRLPLAQWMVEALNERYQIPREAGTAWVESEQLLPLLDGLDEVSTALQFECIVAINEFRYQYGLLPLVICSRSTNYLTQEKRLVLRGGIEILPLALPQIEDYLHRIASQADREKFDATFFSLQDDTNLQEIFSSPLMLNIFAKAYQNVPPGELFHTATPEKIRQIFFDCYIDSMLDYRSETGRKYCQPKQARHWLTWLAQQMDQRDQSEFYLEHMQIDWLPSGHFRRYLPLIGVGCMYALFLGIIKGVTYAFSQGVDHQGNRFGPLRGLFDGLVIGAVYLLTFIVLNGLLLYRSRNPHDEHQRSLSPNYLLIRRIAYGAIIGLMIGIVIDLRVDELAGITNGLFVGAGFVILGPPDIQIKPVQALFWSWSAIQRKWIKFTGLGTVVGIIYGLATAIYWQIARPLAPPFSQFFPCVLFGLILGLILGLFILLMLSTSSHIMNKSDKPNQGIWNLMRNSLLLGGSSWILFGVCFGLAYSILLPMIFPLFGITPVEYSSYFPKDTGVLFGLVNGLAVGTFFWAYNGGTACTLHFVLRFFLWQTGCIPWHYSRFLDYSAERVLLYKIGGGYIFRHSLLLKHFCYHGKTP